jgi:hypothetical protein
MLESISKYPSCITGFLLSGQGERGRMSPRKNRFLRVTAKTQGRARNWSRASEKSSPSPFPRLGQRSLQKTNENVSTPSMRAMRYQFQETLQTLIGHNFPRASILKSSLYSNRAYPLSGKYVRVIFNSGMNQWHAIAAGPHESQANIDGLLSHGLLWREYSREQKFPQPVKLILIAPAGKALVLGSRLAWISGAGRQVLLMEMDVAQSSLRYVELSDCGNLDTALTRVHRNRALPGNFERQHSRGSAERLLQELLLQDLSTIDPALNSRIVYPQVPAFLAGDRGMIDILSVTKQGRLAILELKVSEDIELPMQGLDYWLRVRWHQERGEFQKNGYFPGLVLSPHPPLLYFVGPQFRYHDSFPKITKYILPEVPLCQVGINENWKEGVKVLKKKYLNQSSF